VAKQARVVEVTLPVSGAVGESCVFRCKSLMLQEQRPGTKACGLMASVAALCWPPAKYKQAPDLVEQRSTMANWTDGGGATLDDMVKLLTSSLNTGSKKRIVRLEMAQAGSDAAGFGWHEADDVGMAALGVSTERLTVISNLLSMDEFSALAQMRQTVPLTTGTDRTSLQTLAQSAMLEKVLGSPAGAVIYHSGHWTSVAVALATKVGGGKSDEDRERTLAVLGDSTGVPRVIAARGVSNAAGKRELLLTAVQHAVLQMDGDEVDPPVVLLIPGCASKSRMLTYFEELPTTLDAGLEVVGSPSQVVSETVSLSGEQ